MTTTHPRRFQVPWRPRSPLGRGVARLIERPLARALALDELDAIYARAEGPGGPGELCRRALDDLGVRAQLDPREAARIPARGPVVVVANHPHGILDGLVLGSVLARARPDVKLLANDVLAGLPGLSALFLAVDPFGGAGAPRRNLGALRQALRWLEQGGLVALFPAGEVSHLDLRAGRVSDPAWSECAAWLARRAGAPVVPVHLAGQNSALFQLAGLVHPRLRTALLPRELLRKQDTTVRVRVAPAASLPAGRDPVLATALLRGRCELLGVTSTRSVAAGAADPAEALALPEDPAALAAEVAGLGPAARLLESGDHAVLLLRGDEAPALLRELGRLRELTFRAVGEGTGRARDLDRFDLDYLHLVVWSRARRAILGAYRLGPTDELLRRGGPDAVYTRTLFRWDRRLLERLGPALELGRAFVRPEDQRAHAPLALLWRGIGRFVARHPRYRRLFGPVSLSARLDPLARRLIVAHLETRRDEELATLVRAPRPPAGGPLPVDEALLTDPDAVAQLVDAVEPAGVPVLVRQYVRLGARFLAASVDPDFASSLDCLVVLDLAAAERRLLERTLGKAEAATLLAALAPPPLRRAG